jgi:hypothetical protein
MTAAMTSKLTGQLTDVFPVEPITPNFSKRVFWLKQPSTERYPQHWEIELHQGDVGQIDAFKIGDTLQADVEIRGKHYVGRGNKEGIITSLKCTGLRRIAGPPPPPRAQARPATFSYPEIAD